MPQPRAPRLHGPSLVFSCEHGGHRVPAAHTTLFAGAAAVLASHRGWDPGALVLARQFAAAFAAPLFAATTTRLLVDLNRSPGHRQLFSEFTRGLPRRARDELMARHYRPHRDAVEAAVAQHLAAHGRVLHIASHSFTPVWHGVLRPVDVAWLYDPRRAAEARFAARWMAALAVRAPELRLRRNHPYQGRCDGLASLLRTRAGDGRYLGIELEVNQRFAAQGGAVWKRLRADLVASLAEALKASTGRSR